MRWQLAALVFVLVFVGKPAAADVAEAGAGSFLLRYEADVPGSPDRALRAFGELPRWWNAAHTYSGDARRRMSLDLEAGGCLCEHWGNGQSVEHARVVLVMENEGAHVVRLSGALGPLQEMGVAGIMTFTLSPDPQGTKLSMTYRVSGDPALNLNGLAPAVDQVLAEQFGRFARYTSGNSPS